MWPAATTVTVSCPPRWAAAVERGAPPAELVKTAGGRIDVLSALLATAERGSEMRRPVLGHVERPRTAVELASP